MQTRSDYGHEGKVIDIGWFSTSAAVRHLDFCVRCDCVRVSIGVHGVGRGRTLQNGRGFGLEGRGIGVHMHNNNERGWAGVLAVACLTLSHKM